MFSDLEFDDESQQINDFIRRQTECVSVATQRIQKLQSEIISALIEIILVIVHSYFLEDQHAQQQMVHDAVVDGCVRAFSSLVTDKEDDYEICSQNLSRDQ